MLCCAASQHVNSSQHVSQHTQPPLRKVTPSQPSKHRPAGLWLSVILLLLHVQLVAAGWVAEQPKHTGNTSETVSVCVHVAASAVCW
jgi:hypothetical protein